MEIPLTDYFLNLRTALADPGVAGAYAWADEQLAGGLLTTVQTGLGSKTMSLSEDKTKIVIVANVENYDARGYLVFQTALIMLGGNVLFSHKSRGLAVTYHPQERAMTLDHIRLQIKRLESAGDPHGTGRVACLGIWQDLQNALCPTAYMGICQDFSSPLSPTVYSERLV